MLEIDYTLKTVLGYIISFGYSALIIVIGEVLWRRFHVPKEITRKIEHLLACVNWIIGYLFFGPNIHLAIMNGVSTLILIPLILLNKFKAVERSDSKSSYGLIWFAFSTFITASLAVFVNKDWYILTGIPYYCMVFGDGLAPLTAKLANRSKRDWNLKPVKDKSIVGMMTVLIISVAVVVTFNYVFGLQFDWLFMISLGCLAAMLELYGLLGLDNLILELFVFGYLILQYYGLASTAFEISFIVGIPVIILSALTKALSTSGLILSFVYFSALSYCLQYVGLLTVVILFFAEGIISAVASGINKKKTQETEEKPLRNGLQIFSTGFGSICGAVLYCVFRNPVFLLAALASIATEFADSISSDVGRLSHSDPVDILRFKRIPAGISGGVSLLGSAAGFVMAFASCAVPYILISTTVPIYFILVAISFVGVFLDSILGSGLQILYRCPVCETLTEETVHCDSATSRVKGFKLINNSMINLITGALVCAAAIGIFWAVY